ncbi:hypothetical protein SBRCBS47491_006816 [Sporothrix bragantina]|uniref:WD repeat protein n=1 Tax=Sporothrix bragantina TaxID=671064 RepID=A0ABP0C985_9PEZI
MSDSEDYDAAHGSGDDAQLQSCLPSAFGKQTAATDFEAQIERTRRPAWKAVKAGDSSPATGSDSDSGSGSGSDSDSDDDDDDGDELDRYPLSHELVFKTHEKAVTSVSLDPTGGRMATGSRDCTVKLYDFASMTPTTLRAFKSVDPWQAASKAAAATSESHPINHVAFHPQAASVLLCITAHPQAKILSRDGAVLTEFVKGDMYLRDMHNTKGHVGEIATGAWHPTDRETCITAGADSTLRIWDVNNKRSQRDVIVFKSRAAGSAGRSRMTAVAWGASSAGGSGDSGAGDSVIVAAALDGSLVLYSGNGGPYTRPAAEIRDAHAPNTWTSGIDVSADGRMVVTRGGDGFIKLWDTRKFKQPLVTVSHASTADRFPMSSIRYGPNSMSILVGSVEGDLHVLNPGNLRPEVVTPITPGSALVVAEWHEKLNQVVTGSANGETHVLYDPERSLRAAADIVRRAPKKRHIDDDSTLTMDQSIALGGDNIVVPGAQQVNRRRKGGAAGNDMSNTGKSYDPRRPTMPQQTPFMHNRPDDKSIEKNIPLSRMLHEDPREELLKYAEAAKKDPIFTAAYRVNAPVTEYAELSDEEDGPDKKRAKH